MAWYYLANIMSAVIRMPVRQESTETKIQQQPAPLDPVVVHIECAPFYAHAIRVWRTTYLIDLDSTHRSAIIDAKNITFHPRWRSVRPGYKHRFTLYFEPLPKSVRQFDLQEIIPEPRGWHFPGIMRNREDIYQLYLPN